MPFERAWRHPDVKLVHKGVTVYRTYHDDDYLADPFQTVYTCDPRNTASNRVDFDLDQFDIPKEVGDPAKISQHDDILRWLIDQGMLSGYMDGALEVWDTWEIYVETTFGQPEILVESFAEWAEAMQRPFFRTYASVEDYPHGFVALGIEKRCAVVYPRTERDGYIDFRCPALKHPEELQEMAGAVRSAGESAIRTATLLEQYCDQSADEEAY